MTADSPGPRSIEPDARIEAIGTFVEDAVAAAGADGTVVVLDGRVDSTVAATLAVDALGPDGVRGLVLPCNLGTEAATLDARAVASALGIGAPRIHLQPLLTAFTERVTPEIEARDETVALGNAIARLRTTCAYFAADVTGRLVLGSANRTDRLLGRGVDHAADLLPLGDLYATEVRGLARRLDVPEPIVRKPDRDGVRAGAPEFGDPATVDRILHRLVRGESADAIAAALDADTELVERVERRLADSEHWRRRPATPGAAGVRS